METHMKYIDAAITEFGYTTMLNDRKKVRSLEKHINTHIEAVINTAIGVRYEQTLMWERL